MRVFVTGATGYIGAVVCEALLRAGHTVAGLARSDERAHLLATRGIRAHPGDLRNAESLTEGARNAEAVIHTALPTANAGDVDRHAVEAMLGPIFVYTSGCWVMGNTGEQIADEDTPIAPTPLVAWRPPNEKLVLDSARGIVIRPVIVYGRGGGLVKSFVESAREQGAARVIGDGLNRWTFVHVDDLADLYVRALGAPAGTLLFAAHGPALPVRDVAQAASRAAGAEGKVEFVPLEEARRGMGPFADALALDQQISGQRATRILGWRPRAPSVLDDVASGSYS